MENLFSLLAGAALAVPFLAYATSFQPHRETTIVANGLLGAALVYLVFAMFSGGPQQLMVEGLGLAVFSAFAWLGVRRSVCWAAAGWGIHALWDIGLHGIDARAPIAPAWYPVACIAFDLLVAAVIIWRRVTIKPYAIRRREGE